MVGGFYLLSLFSLTQAVVSVFSCSPDESHSLLNICERHWPLSYRLSDQCSHCVLNLVIILVVFRIVDSEIYNMFFAIVVFVL